MSKSKILGIDPGTIITGFGVIEVEGRKMVPIDYGCIRPKASKPLPYRYRQIFESILDLIDKHKPDAVAVETQFIKDNVQSAMKIGMARGVIILAAALRDVPIYEIAPSKAKMAVTGSGRASKEQVQRMVAKLLALAQIPEPEDAADALALAICHSQGMVGAALLKGATKELDM